MESSADATVGSIIHNGQWVVAVSNDIRAIQIRQLLSSCRFDTDDKVFWNGDGKMSIGTIWDSLRRRSTAKDWLPLLWHKFHIPACSFIAWLACRERLPTKDRMEHFQLNIDPKCLLCHSCNETTEHLFASCPYTYIILRACPFNILISWSRWMRGEFIQDNISSVQKNIVFLYITVTIYLVWLERNGRNHGKPSTSVSQLLFRVKRMVREKLFSCGAFRKALRRDPTLSQILY